MAFENREGQQVPEVSFKVRADGAWKVLTTHELFANKKVVLFSLPGAFTPTCSSSHVPRYNQLADVFAENGVDEILCVSVNDTFVMNAWQEDQEADAITFIPDGNGEFTAAMGLLVEKDSLGFGKRSWRYSMLVDDGVIQKMFIEPEVEGDPFQVSDADTMLAHINADAKAPHDVLLLTKPGCSFCTRAKSELNEAGIGFSEVRANLQMLRAVAQGRPSTPQIFVDGKYIGGSTDLTEWLAAR